MADSSISVTVRIRPFSPKEQAQLAPQDTATPFCGDGGLGGVSPSQSHAAHHHGPAQPGATSGVVAATAPGSLSALRSRFLRPIIQAVDDRVLIFDPPDSNPLSRLYTAAAAGSSSSSGGGMAAPPPSSTANSYAHGIRRHKDLRYAFDRVFDESCTQEIVFENTTKPLLDGILNGYNASVFAYGATGCGKTHTISGTPDDPGVIFLTMRELYQRIEDCREDSEVNVRLSYLEIYNETIRDLLSPEPTPPGQGLLLREDAINRISVVGITEHEPESPESVLRMIHEGNQRRTMSPTEANAVSSRSHAVLQINVTQRPRASGTVEQTTSASLNIIDLAGSERAAATRNNGARMKEGANINKSLLALGNCINALCHSGGQKGRHIPYRNSKLTRLLKFSLGGNCKTVMIVCVSPSSAHYDETHNTLKYANQAKNIRTKVTRNMLNVDRHVAQYVQAIHELQEENKSLRARLEGRVEIESAAERRKKHDVAKEVEEATTRMRQSTDNVLHVVAERAHAEAVLAAAHVRLVALRARMAELDTALAGHVGASEQPADLVAEKSLLQRLVEREESCERDARLATDVRMLTNSLQMQQAILVAAAHNQKFDEEATTRVRQMGAAMLAEVEAARAVRRYDALLDAIPAEMRSVQDLLTVAARGTVTLGEVSAHLEPALSGSEASLERLASGVRSVYEANEGTLEAFVGQRALAPGATTRFLRTTTINATPTISHGANDGSISASRRGGAAGVPKARPSAAAPASRATRRTSLAVAAAAASASQRTLSPKAKTARIVSLTPAAGTPHNPLAKTHLLVKSPRAKSNSGATRRSSVIVVPMRRASGSGTNHVGVAGTKSRGGLAAATSAGAKPSSAGNGSRGPVSRTKKAFRWADEAGEGAIDDGGLFGVAQPGGPIEEGQEEGKEDAHDEQASQKTSEASDGISEPSSRRDDHSNDVRGQGSGTGADHWEDVSPADGNPIAAKTRGRDSLARSATRAVAVTVAPVASAAGGQRGGMTRPTGGATGNGVFRRQFISKRPRCGSSDEEENDATHAGEAMPSLLMSSSAPGYKETMTTLGDGEAGVTMAAAARPGANTATEKVQQSLLQGASSQAYVRSTQPGSEDASPPVTVAKDAAAEAPAAAPSNAAPAIAPVLAVPASTFSVRSSPYARPARGQDGSTGIGPVRRRAHSGRSSLVDFPSATNVGSGGSVNGGSVAAAAHKAMAGPPISFPRKPSSSSTSSGVPPLAAATAAAAPPSASPRKTSASNYAHSGAAGIGRAGAATRRTTSFSSAPR